MLDLKITMFETKRNGSDEMNEQHCGQCRQND